DADDFWPAEKLAAQEAFLRERPDVAIVFSHMRCFLSPDLSEEQSRARFCPPVPMAAEVAGTSLIRASAFEAIGSFDPRWKVGEFIDWLSRARSAGIVDGMLPDVFLERRIHATNTGITDRSSRADYLKIVKEALDRKRNVQV
ncbi:MAG: glycosyltransferase family 2 protein, partial [Actinobacteria bacterium]|nr:glycosyltransferase family 2 protein [Actinomycetota bacterium]